MCVCICVIVFIQPWLPMHSRPYLVIARAVVVNLQVSATLTAVLPVKFHMHAVYYT